MYRNYFILARYTKELNDILPQSIIINIFTHQKDVLNITLKTKDNEFVTLEISVNPGFPYIRFFHKEIKVKKYVKIFDEIIGRKILNIKISKSDRIIKFELGGAILFYAIRGKFTNVYLMDTEFISFTKVDNNELKNIYNEFNSNVFVNNVEFQFNNNSILSVEDIEKLKRDYPIISKEIWLVYKENNCQSIDDLKNILEKLLTNDLIVLKRSNNILFAVEGLLSDNNLNDVILYKGNLVKNVLNKFIIEYRQQENLNKIYKNITAHLTKELNKISNTLNHLKNFFENEKYDKYYENIANNLMININNIRPGMDKISMVDIYTQENLEVKLNPKLSAYENVNYYYQKQKDYNKEKIVNQKKYEILSERYNQLLEIQKKLEEASYQSLKQIADFLGIKDKNLVEDNKPNITDKFRHFLIDGKYDLFVGKDNESNDLLTVKFAKPNDLWLHVKGAASAHGILRKVNLKENIPNKVIEKAAQIIAFNSKLKGSNIVPVICTQKKYVVKNKKMEIGEVKVLKEEQVLLVRPALPE